MYKLRTLWTDDMVFRTYTLGDIPLEEAVIKANRIIADLDDWTEEEHEDDDEDWELDCNTLKNHIQYHDSSLEYEVYNPEDDIDMTE